MTDLAVLAARFGAALRAQGVAVGADRSARFAQAILLVRPRTPAELYRCALATLVSTPDEIEVLERVFAAVFGTDGDPADFRGDRPNEAVVAGEDRQVSAGTAKDGREREVEIPAAGSATERLAARDFADLDPGELALLRDLMRRFRIATPLRRSRRKRAAPGGRRVDMRETLRGARRSGGEPVVLRRWVPREKPRKLVVLCDISGSMEAHARAMLQLLVCANLGARAEVFTFATRLTRLTRALAGSPAKAMRQAGEEAPDWSGGTRIGAALKEFLDSYGARGMARGAVVVIISDGWETGGTDKLAGQMARLSRLAHRVVWVNPRTAKPGYRPLVGGMAAVWPYCGAVVSAHRLDALDALLAAVG
ncbi:VWA domain-containing protein [Amycolatopsis acidiphila]|uniref:VWA domain-containing protein n=1 Tax=Amycolatopsis acidiphila TaxID=715473 RepID=A0A558A600_9PSEU|nr:VWA domain-containing protein [Amycolatopsis acidiphila]TVT19665.1 VWA domain-containing protein [Amycolatopsis acidiphila]UIJ61817.1 VWA domain-containing protein [Amycolatopsis acidiphila]GHG57780.1 VWA domain-containing protein [Amycolatopsis acidiphila]